MEPNNPKLHNMLLGQAKAKYPSKGGPNKVSRAALRWFKDQYSSQGGGYVQHKSEVDPKLRDFKKEAEDKEKNRKKKLKKQGWVV